MIGFNNFKIKEASIHRFIISLIAMIFISGCTAIKTFPYAARAGDTITIAVGSPDNMTKSNTNLTFTSDTDSSVTVLPIRSILKLYADKTSSVYQFGATNVQSMVDETGHEPWLTTIVLDLPEGITAGSGVINVTTDANYPPSLDINTLPISLEILTGTGTSSSFDYYQLGGTTGGGNLSLLEPLAHAKIRPPFSDKDNWPTYGAMEVKLSSPTSAGTTMDRPLIRLVMEDLALNSLSDMSWSWNIRNGEDISIIITSPQGKLRFYEARFSVVIHSAYNFSGVPVINEINYYDVNGDTAVGPNISGYTISLE